MKPVSLLGSIILALTISSSSFADKKDALAGLQKLADSGVAEAQYMLANYYTSKSNFAKGDEKEKAKKSSIFYYKKAANLGHVEAIEKMADKYRFGYDVPKDIKKSIQLYEKAASKGSGSAMSSLAFVYSLGRDVPKNETLAYSWSKKAILAGYLHALSQLAMAYSSGSSVEKNYIIAGGLLTMKIKLQLDGTIPGGIPSDNLVNSVALYGAMVGSDNIHEIWDFAYMCSENIEMCISQL